MQTKKILLYTILSLLGIGVAATISYAATSLIIPAPLQPAVFNAAGNVVGSSTPTTANYVATSTTAASVFPLANITKLSNLTTNGFVKTSSGNGTLSIDTNTYITGNQSITLSGAVSGSGATSITTTYAGILGNTLGGTGVNSSSWTGLALTTTGTWSQYAGSNPCTNQVALSISASGVISCTSVSNAMLSNSTISGVALGGTLAALTATDGTLTFSGSYTGTTARTVGLNLSNANIWSALQQFTGNASSTQLSVPQKAYFGSTATTTIDSAGNVSVAGTLNVTGQTTLGNASTTRQSVATELVIPAAANPTIPGQAGDIAIDTTAASSSVHYSDGSAERALFDVTSVSFNYATSSPAGTTTIQIAGPIRKVQYTQMGCTSVGGTVNVQLGSGSASSTMITSGTSQTTAYTTLSSNNAFTQGQVYYIALGTWSSTAITQTTCSLGRRYDPN